jgi:copper homeostasis protein
MKIELCAATVEAIKLAKECKVDRIELCQVLELGGVTPSPGIIEYAVAYGLETHVLIRPRPGGFIYTEEEKEIMLRNALECKELGASGVVVGVLNAFGDIDTGFLELVRSKVGGEMQITFHRAFDDTFDHERSLNFLINSGVDRVLSSGMGQNVDLGMDTLIQMKAFAAGRIEIMPGGGVNVNNIPKLIHEIEPDAIHFSGTVKKIIDEDSKFKEELLMPDESKIIRMVEEVRKWVD